MRCGSNGKIVDAASYMTTVENEKSSRISLPFPKVLLIIKTKAQGDYMNSAGSSKLVSGRPDDPSILCI